MSTIQIVTCVHCEESFFDDSATPLEYCPHCLQRPTFVDQEELFAHEAIENWCPNALATAPAARISAPELLIQMRRRIGNAIDRPPPQSLPQHHHSHLWWKFFFQSDSGSDGETEDRAENDNGPAHRLNVHDGHDDDDDDDGERVRNRFSIKR